MYHLVKNEDYRIFKDHILGILPFMFSKIGEATYKGGVWMISLETIILKLSTK